MIERCPRCSELDLGASGPELKVSSEGSADKIWLLDVAPEASASDTPKAETQTHVTGNPNAIG